MVSLLAFFGTKTENQPSPLVDIALHNKRSAMADDFKAKIHSASQTKKLLHDND